MPDAFQPSVLLVDDDVGFVRAAAQIARAAGCRITVAGSLAQARARMRDCDFDLALIDLALPDGSGLDLVDSCDISSTQLVLITGHPSVESAVRALKTPVLDYLIKPLDPERYRQLLADTAARIALPPPAQVDGVHGLAGESAALRSILTQIERVGPTDASVLVQGESGVGKELVARAVHEASGRSGDFVAINCGAVAPELLASQLFGHERGSFTGAAARHLGYFEQARGGTLFLDELTEMPTHLQAHLLRALETHSIRRVGGTEDIVTDVRIVAATNRSPHQAIHDGRLREDLFYRIGEFPIVLPPLRERPDDIPVLASLFLRRLNERYGTQRAFSNAAMDQLRRYSWPGNVRELRNVVNRAFILADGDVIEQPIDAPQVTDPLHETPGTLTIAVGMTFDDIERRMLFKTLRFFENDKARAASALGVSVKTIYNRLARYQAADADDAARSA
ncbi:sigma-54-dependent transcriptional regulator [Chiayiivirga flava]|uniref:DNA-binding NtrC family response regulator n=1 Tax=Chiayiivirga flava TaxID=659595 RepID=A0A7W8D495_9GAMM|nr:sigma-54 dependent transcriptional regulator [Chiayiivirga flava]MBB5206505.1 DNA-binding NtrC family response regulator [Chiayiivirga flava]